MDHFIFKILNIEQSFINFKNIKEIYLQPILDLVSLSRRMCGRKYSTIQGIINNISNFYIFKTNISTIQSMKTKKFHPQFSL